MTAVDMALMIGAAAALALTGMNFRAMAWVMAMAASYAISTAYWRIGMPHGAMVAGLADAAVCLGVYFFGRLRWEMHLWRVFQVSVAINVIYLGGEVGVWQELSHNAYSVMLEAVNWAALALIGGTGIAQAIGAANDHPVHSILRPLRSLFRERKTPAFTKVRHLWTK